MTKPLQQVSPTKRYVINGLIYVAVLLGSRALSAIYGPKYRRAKAAGQTFYVDDLPMAPKLEPHETAAGNSTPVPLGPAYVPHPFKSRLTKQGRYAPAEPTIAFRNPPVSGRIIAGVGENEKRRAPRTFFHGLDTPYGAFEGGYPVYTSQAALDRVGHAIFKNRRAEGPINPTKQPIDDPVGVSQALKDKAMEMGAVAAGCTQVTEEAVYDTVDEYLPHAIVVAFPMEREKLLQVPSKETLQGVMNGYHDVNSVALALGEEIRRMGWQAEASANLGGCDEAITFIPLAVNAGLGTMGRHGSLITPTHGSNVRLAAVLTDMPLDFDSPVDFGLEDMCASCHVCQYNCPPNAIYDTKQTVRGETRWHVDMDRCLPYFLENEGCGICITVCPWAETEKAPLLAMLHTQRQKVAASYPAPLPEQDRLLTLAPEPTKTPLVPAKGGAEEWWQDVEVINRIDHPGNIVELHLSTYINEALPDWSEGAHIELSLPSGKVRAYSLSDLPGRAHYRIAVKVDREGTGGSLEVGTLKVGDKIIASRPGNNYLVPYTHAHYFLCAGGIGITVMVPLAKKLAQLGLSFEVHYSVKDKREAVFLGELEDAAPGQVFIHEDRSWLNTFLANRADDAAVCMCGPDGYMDAVRGATLSAGLPEASLYSEEFGSEGRATSFDIVLASSGDTVTVPPGETIARALGQRGIHVPVSCGYGICGTCTVGFMDGDADHRDRVLSDEEHASKITLCCSRAKSKTITLDI